MLPIGGSHPQGVGKETIQPWHLGKLYGGIDMAVFQLGAVIKNRREELGITQEDLADGICSVPTLSRIENGERMPTKDHFEMLMQRLGYSAASLDFFTDKQDFQIYELKFKIRQEYVSRNYAPAGKYMRELESILKDPTKIDRQFILLHDVLINKSKYTNGEKLEQLEEAIQLTCPKFKSGIIPKVLSYDEIILLNNIAICHHAQGDTAQAIEILTALKEYFDHHVISVEEALRTQPMILYNLSKYLGLSGRYDECIEICDLGIRIARTTGRCPLLGETLFNRAWALLQRNRTEDREVAKRALKDAIYFSHVIGDQKNLKIMQEFYTESFGEPISL